MYRFLLREIQDLVANLPGVEIQWKSVMIDFEAAAQLAFREIFYNIRVKECYFHFTQAIWRWINERHILRYLYKDNENGYEFNLFVRTLMALAFLRVEDVATAFELLLENYNASHPDLFASCEDIHEVCMVFCKVFVLWKLECYLLCSS